MEQYVIKGGNSLHGEVEIGGAKNAALAILAAAIGGGMADLLTAPMWVLPTIVIKALITLSFTSKGMKIVSVRNIIATLIALVISKVLLFTIGI